MISSLQQAEAGIRCTDTLIIDSFIISPPNYSGPSVMETVFILPLDIVLLSFVVSRGEGYDVS